MDEKHRKYCIKLGNPYMMDERYNMQAKNVIESQNYPYFQNGKEGNENWFSNNRKNNY